MINVNVDGSSIGNLGSSDFGGLLRNSSRGWIIGFVGNCGFTSNINSELQANSHGLDIAWNYGFKNKIRESDYQTTLKFIQEGVSFTLPYAPLMDYIQSLIKKEWQFIFLHTLRKENASSNWLSKLEVLLVQALKVFSICPFPLINICLAKSMGIKFPGA